MRAEVLPACAGSYPGMLGFEYTDSISRRTSFGIGGEGGGSVTNCPTSSALATGAYGQRARTHLEVLKCRPRHVMLSSGCKTPVAELIPPQLHSCRYLPYGRLSFPGASTERSGLTASRLVRRISSYTVCFCCCMLECPQLLVCFGSAHPLPTCLTSGCRRHANLRAW